MSYYCNVYPPDTLWPYKYVVVLSRYQGKYLLSRHKKRTTWETQGGHIEPGETPLQAAKRELFEESGALRYQIEPLFDYRAGDPWGESNGVVFLAEIEELGRLTPEQEDILYNITLKQDELGRQSTNLLLFYNLNNHNK